MANPTAKEIDSLNATLQDLECELFEQEQKLGLLLRKREMICQMEAVSFISEEKFYESWTIPIETKEHTPVLMPH